MSRYFFHIIEGGPYLDTSGVELADFSAAMAEAEAIVEEIIRDNQFAGEPWSLRIANERDEVLDVIRIAALPQHCF